MKYFKIKPKKGLKVPKPRSRIFLKEEGEEVAKSSYWLRRVADGDVSEVKSLAKAKKIKEVKEVTEVKQVKKKSNNEEEA